MPNIDITRDATDLRKHYGGVLMQQGRVLTDDDFNEAERLDAEDARRVRADVIGPAGSPDDGFLLKSVGGQLTLNVGTYYVGGLRAELEADEQFNNQRDWLEQGAAANETLTAPMGPARFDFIWLDVWQQPVTAVEDSELIEAALGGPETSARMRTMRRARALRNVGNVDCADAWTQLLASLNAEGTVDGDYELVPNATLTVAPDLTAGAPDLCSPPVNGGYLGANNQAIRVQITGANRFTWGFDNGAPLYRVQLLPDNGGVQRRIRMLTSPKDQVHYPLEGQVVELLPWSALLFNGQKNAELAGHLAKVNGGYNPVTREFFIDTAPPNDTGAPPLPFGRRWTDRAGLGVINNEQPPEDTYFYLRVWNRGDDTASTATIPFVAGTPVQLQRTGLQVTFAGTNLRNNDFWIIAARPDTPNTVVPWELMTGRRPHGVRRWIAPLGMIRWPGNGANAQIIDDCRPTFLPLTRLKGCCTYTVGDGTHSYGNFSSIQQAVNALPQPRGGRICVLAGNYDESVVIDDRFNITIHGCGRDSLVRAVTSPVDGMPLPGFLVSNSESIVIEDLRVQSGPRSAFHITNSRHVTVRRGVVQMRDLATVWPGIFSRGDDIVIESNLVEVIRLIQIDVIVHPPNEVHSPPDPVFVGNAARGGIQLAGGSDRVRVVNNVIQGGIWNGITLGSLQIVGQPDDGDDTPDEPSSRDPCDPCRPVDLTPGRDPNNPVRYESAGDLYDIDIIGNRITDMGINGIGVVRFFDLARQGDMIGVHGLHIRDNFITRCMRRDLAVIASGLHWFVAYGGIALAKVSDLRIVGNEIVRNGTNHIDPICGVFAIIVQGLQFDDNRIIENGPRTDDLVRDAHNGIRGGVHIWMILPLDDHTASWSPESRTLARRFNGSGVPTCWMRDNIIVAPLGRSVTFFSVGSVVVSRNRLVTQATTGAGLDLLATTVMIGNLGISNEWTLGLFYAMLLGVYGKVGAAAPDKCETARILGWVRSEQPLEFWPPLISDLNWSSGKTLVTENQITLDVADEPLAFSLSSILILSLDDLGFADNQCEATTTNVYLAFDAFLIAGSVRVADNRFAETWMRAAWSAWSLALMNTTTDNQATHCLRATALLPGLRMFRDNLALLRYFCPNQCDVGHGEPG